MSFTALARQILRDAEELDRYIRENNLPQPSIDVNGPMQTIYRTKAAMHAHANILASTHKLAHLAQGPAAAWLGTMNGGAGDVVTSEAIYRFNIADHVPLDGEVSFEDVALKSGLDIRDFSMIVRYAMTNFIFCEPRLGYIAHSAASRWLKENRLIRSLMGMATDEIIPAMMKETEVLQRYPGSQETSESAWSLANNAQEPMFEELQRHHPHRAATMAFAMEALGQMFADSVQLEAYDWGSLGKATIVDVGGGKGLACRVLAKQYLDLSFIVQDLEDTVQAGQSLLVEAFRDKIKFQVHDFFTTQPVQGADVYYFRAIFHDYPDKYCIKILQNLIPALKKGAKVIVHDPHTKEAGTMPLWQDRIQRASNLRMKIFFNAHNRETREWPELFAKADKKFKINSIKVQDRVPNNDVGETMAVVEAIWDG